MRDIISRILPNLEVQDFTSDFFNAGIDSIDLVSLRVEIESRLGRMIPNKEWLSFKTVDDVVNYCETVDPNSSIHIKKPNNVEDKTLVKNFINMPQMCLEGLSENWLFKEAGSLHWDMLCAGLNTPSVELTDELGSRLYATFVRIRIEGSHSLGSFQESRPYEFISEISRYGMGMFFSKIDFKSEEKNIKLEMMTSFSIRKSTTDNKSLVKSQPAVDDCDIKQNAEFPVFGNEYRLIKKGDLKTFFYKDYIFNISEESIFTSEYKLNPYYDLNGVGLLYFAAYPIISDFCALPYFRQIDNNWEENYFTLYRDIMYYANCDAHDTIIYHLNSVENLKDDKVKITSSLYRKSDQKLMARVFVVKQMRNA